MRFTLKTCWLCLGVLLWTLALQSSARAGDCDAVTLQPVKPLQFGTVGMGTRRHGWIVLDPSGGFAASNEVALLGKTPPSPGLVRVVAPPGSVILLHTAVRRYVDAAYGVTLSGIGLGFRGRPLEKSADFWVLRMPDSASTAPLNVDLSIGGLLNFQIGERIPATQFFVALDCVGYQPR